MSVLGRAFANLTLLLSAVVLAACASETTPAPPLTAASPTADAGRTYVVVQRGQSLDQISRSLGVAKGDIIAANNLGPPYSVRPGAVLIVPGAAALPMSGSAALPKANAAAPRTKPDRIAEAPAKPRRPKTKTVAATTTASGVIPLD